MQPRLNEFCCKERELSACVPQEWWPTECVARLNKVMGSGDLEIGVDPQKRRKHSMCSLKSFACRLMIS